MERRAFRLNGFGVLLGLVVAALAGAALALTAGVGGIAVGVVVAVLVAVGLTGFTVINPNEARVIQFFGRYVGSVSQDGFQWVLPLTTKRRITLRVRNFETAKLKVNDADGNPVEIAAVVVYKVVDSGKASFAVDDYEEYVAIQSEAAVRHLATTHPYDSHEAGRTSLRDGSEVAAELTAELGERTDLAGVEVVEARITHLAYAPEIAQSMLVRQQAAQVVAARTRIVEGAVGMVGLALERLAEQGVVELDEERKAAMVSNLLVVLCGDKATQPVVNTGTLYA
ncbi:SPFH domain-containing protein [Rhodococcus tukisamuensis]|uniref:Regulator of protease activity HflC, stomatin/prohibitin superfamily n=1 Tax=Rhodococcus tukisamuensis TaxID=168276 RepID=A0A1G6Z5A6_9NOCA|nr:SPFH domain-containing protein [Rhodococcus tukisamuensis]SDD97808.1 Regulator of protease activity HflC, stomatin/prohibitin superfamily [Rhodococcus tukisamuensis]